MGMFRCQKCTSPGKEDDMRVVITNAFGNEDPSRCDGNFKKNLEINIES
jgi:hypothetical protein